MHVSFPLIRVNARERDRGSYGTRVFGLSRNCQAAFQRGRAVAHPAGKRGLPRPPSLPALRGVAVPGVGPSDLCMVARKAVNKHFRKGETEAQATRLPQDHAVRGSAQF